MSKIPFSFTGMPKFFSKHGILDLKSPRSRNRLVFLYWAFSKCYTVFSLQEGIEYDAYSFSCTVDQCANECGFTFDEAKAQFKFFIDHGFLIKVPNSIKNRVTMFKWDISKLIEEKVVSLQDSLEQSKEKTPNQKNEEDSVHNLQKPPTDYRDESSQKPPTDLSNEKDTEKVKNPQPNQKTPNQTPNQTHNNLRVEKPENPNQNPQPNTPFYRSDRAIEPSLYNSDNVAKPRAREDSSLSSKGKITALFNPMTYRLRNGEHLSYRMQKALNKYSPRESERLLPNVQYYEQWVDDGKPIKRSHEAFLQYCISEDMASKKENARKNDLYAKYIKSEYEAHGIEILQTVVTLKKSSREEPYPISKELPPSTFENILDAYIENYYPNRFAYAK
jgi:hypothetical protein